MTSEGVIFLITSLIPTLSDTVTDTITITMVERIQIFAIPTAFCFILNKIPEMLVKLAFL